MKNAPLVFLLSISIFGAALALPQSSTTTSSTKTKKARTSAKTVARASTAKATTARASTAKKTAAKKGKSGKKAVNTAAAAPRSRQIAPTPERYREIQQALADKGYLKSEPNGVWDAQSADALSRFQADRKLTPTGKITSASLIGLGLGPKSPTPGADPPKSPEPAPPNTPVTTPEN